MPSPRGTAAGLRRRFSRRREAHLQWSVGSRDMGQAPLLCAEGATPSRTPPRISHTTMHRQSARRARASRACSRAHTDLRLDVLLAVSARDGHRRLEEGALQVNAVLRQVLVNLGEHLPRAHTPQSKATKGYARCNRLSPIPHARRSPTPAFATRAAPREYVS